MVTPALRVRRPGMLTTVQDLGRWGYQAVGVPVAGPMDWYSHRLANLRVGNSAACASLEITLIGPEFEIEGEVTCALAGADFRLFVNDAVVDPSAPFVVRSGDRLRLLERRSGARASLAVAGGFDLPSVLGSRSTSLISRMGPFGGRALKAGDRLPVGHAAETREPRLQGRALELPQGGCRLRVIPGPHDERFTAAAHRVFTSARFTVTPDSNRMGYRLAGPVLERGDTTEMLSDGTPVGSIQVPPSGLPILLMADRQTTGGYPKIATVITADLPLAGQLAPGDWIEFAPCTVEEALAALGEREAALEEGSSERLR
jgi:antagonist of KipI